MLFDIFEVGEGMKGRRWGQKGIGPHGFVLDFFPVSFFLFLLLFFLLLFLFLFFSFPFPFLFLFSFSFFFFLLKKEEEVEVEEKKEKITSFLPSSPKKKQSHTMGGDKSCTDQTLPAIAAGVVAGQLFAKKRKNKKPSIVNLETDVLKDFLLNL